MNFLLADTFRASLARLTNDEQKAVKITVFDLQANPASPGHSFHKLDRAKDKNFWSVRVGRDIRIIVHKTADSLLACYVDHHDKAYDWAERRKLETHPTTGAAQLIEMRETVKEIVVPHYVHAAAPAVTAVKKALFAEVSDDRLLGFGVPVEWLGDVKNADEDELLALTDYLPAEASEALLQLATGDTPQVTARTTSGDGPLYSLRRSPEVETPPAMAAFEHPDAQRRFRVIANVEELERALEFPWDRWTVFLHPDQRHLVERDYTGPARVSGSAGTGKTIVALHRAAFLARAHGDARVLLTTFSDTLASALRTRLRRLVGNEPRLAERIDIRSLSAVGQRLHAHHVGHVSLVPRAELDALIRGAISAVPGHKFSANFVVTEWGQVVDAWQLAAWEEYRDVARLGRKTRLPEARRKVLWSIFEKVRADLRARGRSTESGMFTALAGALRNAKNPPYDYVVVDEAQDLTVGHLKFLAAINPRRADALFFAGDLGQRIFQQPFSWKSLGVDVRGRSSTLTVNYRTSHQIRMQTDRLLDPELVDVDGNAEDRSGTVSVFNGPPPMVRAYASEKEEIAAVAEWLNAQSAGGVAAHELGLFVRSEGQLGRAKAALAVAALPYVVLDDKVETTSGKASVSTMHLAKGLEFRAVAVMGCDDEVIPLQERIAAVGDDADLQEIYDTERQLLYVACTRARDQLLVTAVEPASEFLDDMSA